MKKRMRRWLTAIMVLAFIYTCVAGSSFVFAEEDAAPEISSLPEENRLIVRTDTDIRGLVDAAADTEVEGGYILAFDSEQDCAAARDLLLGLDAVDSAEEDRSFQICGLTEEPSSLHSGQDESKGAWERTDPAQETDISEPVDRTESETSDPAKSMETETSGLADHAKTDIPSPADSNETEIGQGESALEEVGSEDPSQENSEDAEIPETSQKDQGERPAAVGEEPETAAVEPVHSAEWEEMDPLAWRRAADLAGKRLLVLIDTGSEEADLQVSLTGEGTRDGNGHGTQMNRLIRESSGGSAYVVSIKAVHDDGKGLLSDIYTAVSLARQGQADVINLSLTAKDAGGMDGLKSLLQEAAGQGIALVCAAGNNGMDAGDYCPANIPAVWTVGACDSLGAILPRSNYGKLVDCFAAASSTSESAALVSGYLCRYGREELASLPDVFWPDEVTDSLAGEPGSADEEDGFHIAQDALKSGSTVKLNGAYNVGPAVSTSDNSYVAEYTFRIGGSTGYCGNIAAGYGMYSSVSATRNYVAGVYDFTDVGGKDVNYVIKQVYAENKNYTYQGKTINGTLLRKILYYSDEGPGASKFGWESFEKGYAQNSYVFSDLPGSNRSSDPNKAKYTKSNAYRKGVVSCACSYVWGQEMGLCTVSSSSYSKAYTVGKRYVDALAKLPNAPDAFTAYFAVLSGEYGYDNSMSVVQPILFWTARDTEQLRIRKTVTLPEKDRIVPDSYDMTKYYSPKGLVYGVYAEKECKNLEAKLTIGDKDASGNYYSGWVTLKHGPHYLKEISNASNKNIAVNTEVKGFWVEMDDTLYPGGKRTLDVSDLAQTGSLQIRKLVCTRDGKDVGETFSAEGVKFGLYTASSGGKKLAELTIGKRQEDGGYDSDILSNIAYGTYYLEEVSLSKALSDAGASRIQERVQCDIIPGGLNEKGVLVAEIKNYVEKPSIKTRAEDKQTGTRQALADLTVEIVDHVTYENLVPGKTYELSGTLMDREKKEAWMIDEKAISSRVSFTPKTAAGSVDLTFTFDGRGMCGKKLSVFEELTLSGSLVAEHKDYNDKNQQIDMTDPASIRITKYDETGAKPLSGVSFTLQDENGNPVKDIHGNLVGEQTSGKDGKVEFSGLPYGSYIITETQTASGYSLQAHPLHVTLPEVRTGAEVKEEKLDTEEAFYSEREDTYYYMNLSYDVSDSPNLHMPQAGGRGYPTGIAAAALLTGAILFWKKIREKNRSNLHIAGASF